MTTDLVTNEDGSAKELKKSVEYVHVAGSLSLVERKIINVLLLYAYDDLLEADQHEIPLVLLCRSIGWTASGNREELKDALRTIRRVELEFDYFNRNKKQRDKDWLNTNPLAEVGFEGGVCTYAYGPKLKKKLKDPAMYALINMHLQRKFQSTYGLALYENTIRFKGVESTGWHTVDEWKGIFGVVKYDQSGTPLKSAYDEFKVFSARVIKVAVNDVNAHSPDYEVKEEYERAGREVKRIRFKLTPKVQQDMFVQADEADLSPESPGWKALESIGCRPTFIKNALVSHGEEWALDVAEECHGAKSPPALAQWFKRTGTTPNKRKTAKHAPATTVVPSDTAPAKKTADKYTAAEKAELRKVYAGEKGARLNARGSFEDANHIGKFNTWLIERG